MNILPKISSRSYKTDEEVKNNLIRYEAKIGANVFGEVPKGHLRQFFCLDEHTWIWHEEWKGDKGENHMNVTKYMVRPSSVIKSQNGSAYSELSDKELSNLVKAVKIYVSKVQNEYNKVLTAAV